MTREPFVLLCGIPSETPLDMVAEALGDLGVPFLVFNQRQFADTRVALEIADGVVGGELTVGRRSVSLEQITGVYTRLMDDRELPEVRDLPPDAPARARCRGVHDTLARWIEVAAARVVNRALAMGTNGSKPFQAQLIRQHGFLVPETLVTNDPDRVLEFLAEQGTLIYKSVSGIRSIVRRLAPDHLSRLDRIRWCPTQFQQCVEGTDVRVHVVDRRVFATRIVSDATDYRYAGRDGKHADLEAWHLEPDVETRCVELAHALDLPFAGIDLRRTPGGEWYCFEVNPSPGFSYYQAHTGQDIAEAVARYLAGEDVMPLPGRPKPGRWAAQRRRVAT